MKKRLFFSLSLMGSVGIATALPLVGLGLLGRYIDNIYGTSPKFLIVFIILSAIISIFILRNIVNEAIEDVKEMS